MSTSRTYVPKASEIQRHWWIADASGEVLGRLATAVANRLRGKTRPDYTPFLDVGDFVVVVNAEKVVLTGDKERQKFYYHHSGYPGGIKKISAGDRLKTQPAEVIRDAVEGMLPHTRLGRRLIRKLKVYAGPEHPHAAQQPKAMPVPGSTRAGRDEPSRGDGS